MISRQSVQSFLGNLYDKFNRNHRVFPLPPSNNLPMQGGIRSIPFDAGMESDNMRRGGMSPYEIASMLGKEMLPTGSGRGISSVAQGPSMNFIPRAEAATRLSPASAGPAEMGGRGRRFAVDPTISPQSYGMAQDPFAGGMPRQRMPNVDPSEGMMGMRSADPTFEAEARAVRPVTSTTGTRLPRRLPKVERDPSADMDAVDIDPGKDAELDAGIDQDVEGREEETPGIELNTNLLKLGLEIASAASKPGATFLGSLAQGGLNHLNNQEKRELIKEQRDFKKEMTKAAQAATSLENRLDRQSREGVAESKLDLQRQELKLKNKELAERTKFQIKKLDAEISKLPTGEERAAELELLQGKRDVQIKLAAWYEAKASGEEDTKLLAAETTKRALIQMAAKMFDPQAGKLRYEKDPAKRRKLMEDQAKNILNSLGVFGGVLSEVLPGVTENLGKLKPPSTQPPPSLTPGQIVEQNGQRFRVDKDGVPQLIE
tara:strand:+ start:199 stop:1662 length:1464 start_codon:yes stop_codon:yes gene_type:complete